MNGLTFFVAGIPKPGGSKTAGAIYRRGPDGKSLPVMVNGRVLVTVRDAAKNRDWKAAVADMASQAMQGKPPFDCPLRLDIIFHLIRPKSHFGSRGLKPSAPPYPAKKPDTTKLFRAAEDAMTGICYRDDSLVIYQWAGKIWSEKSGAEITLTVLHGEAVARPAFKGAMLPGMET